MLIVKTLLAVTPVPLKDTTLAPARLVPLTITNRLVAPWTPALGLRKVIVGGCELATINPPVLAPVPNELVTLTSRKPGAAFASMPKLTVI